MAQTINTYLFFGLLVTSFLYSSEDEYKKLLQTYDQLEQKNFAAWYNIGVLDRELGEEIKATCAFVRAQKQAELFEFERAGRQISQMGNFNKVYGSALYYYVYSIPLYFYQYLFLFFVLLFLWSWYCMIRYSRKKRYTYIIFIMI